MHILLEEVPLLGYYFLTLFLSNCKLRLILSIFWTTSTFCQLPLTCSLTSFVCLALPLLHCGRFATDLLTHFIRLLVCSGLSNARAIALTSFAIVLPSVVQSSSLHFALVDSSLRCYQQALTSFALVDSLVPSISIATCEFVFRFAQYNSRSRGRPSDTFLNVHSLC